MIKKFTKEEVKAVVIIFTVLILVSVPNFVTSLLRARNQTRKDDMAHIKSFIEEYHRDFATYPLSSDDGRILACIVPGDKVDVDERGRAKANLIPCEWGKDEVKDLLPGSAKVYAKKLPSDPHHDQGVRYVYLSDGDKFQIFAALEGTDDAEYAQNILTRNISCGTEICNLGRGYGCEPHKTLAKCEEERLEEIKKQNVKN